MKSKTDRFETHVIEAMEEVELDQDIGVLSKSLNKNVKINEFEDGDQLQNGATYFINNEASCEQTNAQERPQFNYIQVETLIPIDYLYKNITLPLIFVNTCVSGISLKKQCSLVQEDINEVIRYFVDGNITPNDTTITTFFRCNPGTMIYSPQLVKTIVSLEVNQLTTNKNFDQLKNSTRHEQEE